MSQPSRTFRPGQDVLHESAPHHLSRVCHLSNKAPSPPCLPAPLTRAASFSAAMMSACSGRLLPHSRHSSLTLLDDSAGQHGTAQHVDAGTFRAAQHGMPTKKHVDACKQTDAAHLSSAFIPAKHGLGLLITLQRQRSRPTNDNTVDHQRHTFISRPQVPAQAIAADQQAKALAPAGAHHLAAVQVLPRL